MTQEKPNRIDSSASGSQNLYRRPERPKRPEIKPIQTLDSATNSVGKIFNIGDQVRVTPPWGGSRVVAKITGFYKDESGGTWAQYTPTETRSDWTWEGGCATAKDLEGVE